jgi:signal transduction histidine kinase
MCGVWASGYRLDVGSSTDSSARFPVSLPHRASGRRLVALDVAFAAVLVVAGLLRLDAIGARSGVHAPALVLDVLLVLGTAPVAVRRWAPAPSLIVMAVAAAALTGIGKPPLAVDLSTGLSAYAVAMRWQRRPALAAFVAAEVLLAIGVGIAIGRGVAGSYVIHTMLVVAVTWFAGDSVSNRRRYEESVAERHERLRLEQEDRQRQAVRQERVRIARELHDVVAHSLTVMTVQAGVAGRVAQEPERSRAVLESIEATGRAAQQELRVILDLLRDDHQEPPELAPVPGLGDLGALIEQVRSAGLPVELDVAGASSSLSPAVELSLYRIVQESLTNVVKHAGNRHTIVRLAYQDDGVRLEVVNDGPEGDQGKSGDRVDGRAGHGVLGMRERVAAFGGTLVAETTAGRGFRVVAAIPLRQA